MCDIDFTEVTERALEIYHLKLKRYQPVALDHYGRSPLSLGDGYHQMDDNLPTVLSLCGWDREYGLMVYYIRGHDMWCYVEVHGLEGQICWDALPQSVKWELWERLNTYHPPQLASVITEHLYRHGLVNSRRKRRRIRSVIENTLSSC